MATNDDGPHLGITLSEAQQAKIAKGVEDAFTVLSDATADCNGAAFPAALGHFAINLGQLMMHLASVSPDVDRYRAPQLPLAFEAFSDGVRRLFFSYNVMSDEDIKVLTLPLAQVFERFHERCHEPQPNGRCVERRRSERTRPTLAPLPDNLDDLLRGQA